MTTRTWWTKAVRTLAGGPRRQPRRFADLVRLEDRVTPVLYVHPTFTAGAIPDADFSTPAAEPATAGVNAFATITTALAAAVPGELILVNGQNATGGPGMVASYAEHVDLTKSVVLLGVGGPTLKATPAAVPTDAAFDLVHVQAGNVTVQGFTLDGLYAGGATGARRGIANVADNGVTSFQVDNLTVASNTFRNLGGRAISVFNDGTGVIDGLLLNGNAIAATYGQADQFFETQALYLSGDTFGTVSNNSITVPAVPAGGDVGDTVGILTELLSQAGVLTISGNTFTVGNDADGVQLFNAQNGASVVLSANKIDAAAGLTADDATDDNDGAGISVQGVGSGATLQMTGNLIGTNAAAGRFEDGVRVWQGTTGVSITGGTIDKSHNGIFLYTDDPFLGQAGGPTTLSITGTVVNARGEANTADYGIYVEAPSDNNGPAADLALSGVTVNAIGAEAIGLYLLGERAGLAGDTLADTAFTATAVSDGYIEFFQFAERNTLIDGTSATFDGLTGGAATVAQNWAIEDNIYHYADDFFDLGVGDFVPGVDNVVGFIRVDPNELFVTDKSNSVARVAVYAVANDIIHVEAGTTVEPFSILLDDAGVTLTGLDTAGTRTITPGLTRFDSADSTDDLVMVLADGLTITGFTFDGRYDAAGPVGARRGVSNIDKTGTPVAVNDLLVTGNTFQDLGGRAISLSNDGTGVDSTGNVITLNTLGTYGQSDPFNEGIGVYLALGAAADITLNTITVPAQDIDLYYGVYMLGFTTGTLIADQNTVSVGLGGSGFSIQAFAGADFSATGNSVFAAAGTVLGSDTYGIDIYEFNGGNISLINNMIGNPATAGKLDIGIFLDGNVLAAPATVTGGSIERSATGLLADETTTTATAVTITTIVAAGGGGVRADNATLTGTMLTINGTGTGGRVDNNGNLTLAKSTVAVGTGKVLEGTDGGKLTLTDTTLAGATGLVDFIGAGSSLSATPNTANATADTFNITGAGPFTYPGSTLSFQYNASAAVETTDLGTAFAVGFDGADTFNVTPSTVTAIDISGGNPTLPIGDVLNLNVFGLTNPVISSPGLPDGTLTSASHKTVTWTGIETLPTPLGLGGSFDFEIATSITQPEWRRALPTDTITKGAFAAAKTGWQTAVLGYDYKTLNVPAPAVPPGTIRDLLIDGNWNSRGAASQGNFQVAVNAEPIQVTLAIGDTYFLRDSIEIYIEGVKVTTLGSLTGEFTVFSTITADANNDGFLVIGIRDAGGHDAWTLPYLDVRPVSLIGELKLSPNPTTPVVADGATFTAYTGTGARPNSLVTISSTVGTPSSSGTMLADASQGPNGAGIAGVQVQADALGNFTFWVRSPLSVTDLTGADAGKITAMDPTGFTATKTALVQSYTKTTLPPVLGRFDFDGVNVLTAPNFTSVRASTLFSTGKGFGWGASPLEFERTAASFLPAYGVTATQQPLYRDAAWGTGTGPQFFVAVAKGATVDLRAYIGDTFAQWAGITITGEGGAAVPVSIPATRFAVVTLSATDANNDGKVFVQLANTKGGSNPWILNGLDVAAPGGLPAAQPQLAGFTVVTGPSAAPATLTADGLAPVVAAGIRQWEATGTLTAWQSDQLRRATFSIGDLDAEGRLGEENGNAITIDDNGGGLGWVIDLLPATDKDLLRGVDLLTVVTHELGHVIGLGDVDGSLRPDDIMAESLGEGVRRSPAAAVQSVSAAGVFGPWVG